MKKSHRQRKQVGIERVAHVIDDPQTDKVTQIILPKIEQSANRKTATTRNANKKASRSFLWKHRQHILDKTGSHRRWRRTQHATIRRTKLGQTKASETPTGANKFHEGFSFVFFVKASGESQIRERSEAPAAKFSLSL